VRSGIVYAVGTNILLLIGLAVGAADISRASPPALSATLAPEKLEFGAQPVGASIGPKTATLTNISASPVIIHDITASGIDFTESNDCPPQLMPGSHCAIEVTFKPAVTGPRLGAVIVTDSDPNALFLVLAGTGQ